MSQFVFLVLRGTTFICQIVARLFQNLVLLDLLTLHQSKRILKSILVIYREFKAQAKPGIIFSSQIRKNRLDSNALPGVSLNTTEDFILHSLRLG